jgi:hypothetical protein
MPLDKQTISVNFLQGLSTKADPKQVMPGKFLTLENGVFTELAELKKRGGFDAVTSATATGGTITAGTGVYPYKDELTRTDSNTFYTLDSVNSKNVAKGKKYINSVSKQPISRGANPQTNPCLAYHSTGLECVVWSDGKDGNTYYSVIDRSTGAQLITSQPIVSGASSNTILAARVNAVGQYFIITYREGTALKYKSIDTSSPFTISSAVTIIASQTYYDVGNINNQLFIVYSSGSDLICKTLSSTLALSGATTIATSALRGTVVGDASNNAWFIYQKSDLKIYGKIYNFALTVVILTETLVDNFPSQAAFISAAVNGTTAGIFMSYLDDTADSAVRFATLTSTGTAVESGYILKRLFHISKVIYQNGTYMTLAYYDLFTYDSFTFSYTEGSLEPTFFLIDQSGAVVSKLLPLAAYGLNGISTVTGNGTVLRYTGLPNISLVENYIYDIALSEISSNQPSDASSIGTPAISKSTIIFSDVEPSSLSIANNLQVSGGFISSYDSNIITEQGFHLFPENIDLAVSATGGNLPAGIYELVAVYEWLDAQGNIYRSAPSVAKSATTTGSTSKITMTGSMLYVTSKTGAINPVTIKIYATNANQTTFLLLNISTIYNDTTATFFTAVYDSVSALSSRLLYTTGGEAENISAPATNITTSFKNRMVVVPSESPLTWWYSKQVIPGSPVEFSDLFVSNIDQRGGDITGLAGMDDKLILFKRNSIFYVVGDGPSPAGTNNNFSEAQLVTTDCGCVNQKSIAVMPEGLIFKSDKGLYLLRRDLGVEYIGSDVEAYNAFGVTSAHLLQKYNQVVFTLDSGIALVYDYFVKQWGVFTFIDAVDSCLYGRELTFIKSNGAVYKQNPASTTDNSAFIQLKFKTSWLSFANLQGFQRVYKMLVLGEWQSAHTLNVDLAYDFIDTVTQSTQIPALTSIIPYQYRVFPTAQKCEAIQATVYDTQDSPYGAGMKLSAIAFEVGAKKGTWKVSAARSFG